MITKQFSRITVIVLLSLFSIVSVTSAMRESLTFDEIVHIEEGFNAIKKHEFHVDTNNPPLIRELAVLPLILGAQQYTGSQLPNMQALPARLVVILLGVVLGISIYFTASLLFSSVVGLIALFLYAFDPNMLAHAHYITQDLGATLFFFLGFTSLVWVIKSRSWISFIVHGFCIGCMAASKVTTLPYYIVTDLIVVPYLLRKNIWNWFQLYTKYISVSVLVCLVVIWATYFFKMNVIVAPGNAQGRVSATLRSIGTKQNNLLLIGTLNFLEKTPVPLGDYIAVIKNTLVRSTKRTSEVFFMGTYYDRMHWYFMPVNIFAKTPIPLVILFITGVWASLKNSKFRRNAIIFLAPICSILAVSSVSGMQPLVRYALPLYPFMYILAGQSVLLVKQKYTEIIMVFLLLWHITSSLSFFPHFISYANEITGPREKLYEKFIDSNLDWGQSLPDLATYVQDEKLSVDQFSYFGRDDAKKYGFNSNFPYGSYKFNEICALHSHTPNGSADRITAISVTNWYACGYYLDPMYSKSRIKNIIGGSIIIL